MRAQVVLDWAAPRLSHSQWGCLLLGLLMTRRLHHVRRTVPTPRHRHSQQPGTLASQKAHNDRAALPSRSVLTAQRLEPQLPKQTYPQPRLARRQRSTTRTSWEGHSCTPSCSPFVLQSCLDGALAVLLFVSLPPAVRLTPAVLCAFLQSSLRLLPRRPQWPLWPITATHQPHPCLCNQPLPCHRYTTQ